MDLTSADIRHKQFRLRWKGLDPREVEAFLQEVGEEFQNLDIENATLKRQLNEQAQELKEYKERERTIRNVLLNAHKTAEQMKANAEKEAKLIISDAELKAEKIIQGAHLRLARLQEDIADLKRQRVQFAMKLRSTIEMYQQLLDTDTEDEESEIDPGNKVKIVNR